MSYLIDGPKSLEMYRDFYGGEDFTTGIERMLWFIGLEEFIKQVEKMMEKGPFLRQVYLMFRQYQEQILNMDLETRNAIAAQVLLERFGPAGIGFNENGEVDEGITRQIIETHGVLVDDVNETSRELPFSVREALALVATIHRTIIDLLIQSQKAELEEFKARKEQEEIVAKHLAEKGQSEAKVVRQSVAVSVDDHEKRKTGDKTRKNIIAKQLRKLTRLADGIFRPVGQELKQMPVAA